MARPKTGLPAKGRINLTVSEDTRLQLAFVSRHTGKSISQLVAEWAVKESKRITRATGYQVDLSGQMDLLDKEV